jgi:hypothetical protein
MVYLAANDRIVATGSAEECTKQMGLKNVYTFYSIVSKAKSGKYSKYEVIVSDTDTLDGDE